MVKYFLSVESILFFFSGTSAANTSHIYLALRKSHSVNEAFSEDLGQLSSNRWRHIAASPGNLPRKHSRKYSKTHHGSRTWRFLSYRNSKLTVCGKPLMTSQRLDLVCTQVIHKNFKAVLTEVLVRLAVYLSLIKCKRGCIDLFVIKICVARHPAEVTRAILCLESPAFYRSWITLPWYCFTTLSSTPFK